jgi:type II secretory pathway component PulJ
MFIDEIQAMQERGEELRKLHSEATDEEFANLQRQLALLDAKCPRYDVHNVFSALNPRLIESDSPVAATRNAELLERRSDLVNLAGKAPMGPPWFAFSVEYRSNERQRVAYLVRAVDEHGEPVADLKLWHRRFIATAIFDSMRGAGQVEYNPNAFELLLNDDDEFASLQYDSRLSDGNVDATKQGAELVRTCIQLLNWDREDVPTQTLVNPKQQKNAGKKDGGANKRKSDPTIIKFEPFLKSTKSGTHRGSSSGTHESPGEHLVKGHYINVKYAHPLFGHKPVLGKTYGRIWIKPHKRGNPERGKLQAPRGVIRLGNISNPSASQPVIPFPATQQGGAAV